MQQVPFQAPEPTSPPSSSAAVPAPMDPRSGFCTATRTFRSLRPPIPLPPADAPVSFPSFALSRLPSPLPAHPAFLDASTGAALSFPALIDRVRSLAVALRGVLGVAKGDVALVLAPPSLDVPVVFLALLSLGAIVSPHSPLSTAADVAHAVGLCSPSIVFATADTVSRVPAAARTKLAVILLDSPQFASLLHGHEQAGADGPPVAVRLSDVAAIAYSSGTTGRTKAVAQSHRRLIASSLEVPTARPRAPGGGPVVTLLGVPMFHSYGFNMLMRGVLMAETTAVVTAPRGGAAGVLAAAARCGATQMFVAPPVVLAMTRGGAGPEGFPDLVRVDCGGAPLSGAAASAFHERFPDVDLSLALGSTEGGVISKMVGHEECCRIKSTGRLCSGVEAKVVDIISGEALSANQQGELFIRSPSVMLGYVGGNETRICAFDSDGWLKTGDLCYFDEDGFLHIVDRLKDLIKYKAYQVTPTELEDLLHLIPGIFDAAVVPYVLLK
ncbi:4-coumarate--CoA ligase-like 7 [Dichanthelium oligosanthes]|uniref:4-coumarate--CoA ligase-like 7 n=1 Tax=Dichanthelium oligosanthes TaxID=888268 RepID=A0A1E5UP67_9POAL|nr:4-coumarate--CoA ligase-like 7 [Dichanthelium oligosanthes]